MGTSTIISDGNSLLIDAFGMSLTAGRAYVHSIDTVDRIGEYSTVDIRLITEKMETHQFTKPIRNIYEMSIIEIMAEVNRRLKTEGI